MGEFKHKEASKEKVRAEKQRRGHKSKADRRAHWFWHLCRRRYQLTAARSPRDHIQRHISAPCVRSASRIRRQAQSFTGIILKTLIKEN